jgi:hypothetical protein
LSYFKNPYNLSIGFWSSNKNNGFENGANLAKKFNNDITGEP